MIELEQSRCRVLPLLEVSSILSPLEVTNTKVNSSKVSPGCRGPSVIREGQRGFTEIGEVKCRHQKCLKPAPSAAHGSRHMSLYSAAVQELHQLPVSHPQMF